MLQQLFLSILKCCCLMVIAGCTSQQLYTSGQYMQRSQCMQLADQNDQAKCISRSQLSYEEYQRQQKGQTQ